MKLEIPRCDEGTLNETRLSFGRAKPGPARVMELGLLHRYRMARGFQVLRGLRIARITRDLVRSRSSIEATAEEWRFQDEAPHACSSKVSRSCDFTASQNPSSLSSFTCSIRAVRLGTQQVKLRGNRRGVASRMKLIMSSAQRYHAPAVSQHRKIRPQQCHILMVQSRVKIGVTRPK